MRTLILPAGKAGWEQKHQIVRDIISSRPRPPFIYNDVLLLVSSARLKRLYGRFFLETLENIHSARCLVPPDIQTLHHFLQQRYATLQGPRLIDEQSRLVLLEGLVKDRLNHTALFGQRPDLLAPSLSAVLAKTVEQLAIAGITPDVLAYHINAAEFSDKPQIHMLQHVFARYIQVLREKNLIDPAGMLHDLRERFDPTWMTRYRMVILDNLTTGEPVEAEILKRIAACTNCVLLVEAPSRGLITRAPRSHPLSPVRDFLESIGPLEVEERPAARGDFSLADALFSDEPFDRVRDRVREHNGFEGTVRLLSAINTREEVSLIARQVKESLKQGCPADRILVSFPALDDYAPLVEELFADFGIPYNRALGRPLGTSAVATALISLMRAAQDDFSAPSLLRVFSSPFLKYAGHPELAPAVDRFLREHNITGGKQKLLAALKYDVQNGRVLSGPVSELMSELEPFGLNEPAALSSWMDRLTHLIAWSKLEDRVILIRGPLNTNQQAFNKLKETVQSLAAAGRTFPEYRYTFSEWLFLLRKTFMHTRFQVPPEDEGGVQVLGLEEGLALPWNEIYLGGMIDAKFPQRLPQNIFLPEQTLEMMGVRTLERARMKAAYHFYRLMLCADTITLTFPEQDGDKPAVRSPFLQELAPLEAAGFVNRETAATSGLQFSLRIRKSRSLTELAKAIAMARPEEKQELVQQLADLPDPRPEIADHIKALLSAEHTSRSQAAVPCPELRDFRVTDLDAYLACPYDYYITRILGIEPLEEVSDDITPRDRGSKVHAVLRDFYCSWQGPVTRENREKAIALLHRLSDAAFAAGADTFRNRRTRDVFERIMAERFVDAEIEFWRQDMKPCWLEKSIDHYPLVLANGIQVHLSGKIDRIDCDNSGRFVVVDYKTGKYPLPKQYGDQDIFQLPIYAMMAKETLAHAADPLLVPIGLAYYDLAGRTGGGARDVVLFDKDARSDHPSSKPRTSPKTAAEFEAILEGSLDKARTAVEGILAAHFPALPRDEAACRFCGSQVMCRKDETD